MAVFYNDADPKACLVLRELIREGVIPDGEVCETPIEELRAADVSGFTRCHFDERGRLRDYRAICPQVAAGFVRAYLDRECQADGT